MTYTVTQLITNSYYLSQVVSRDLDTVSGGQLGEGLLMLNALISLKSANTSLIPYYGEYTGTLVTNQEKYTIPNLLVCDSFTFNIGPVRYPVTPLGRKDYFSTGRVDNIASLSGQYRIERIKGGSDLYVYFLPAGTYPFKIYGKFGYDSVTLNEDLETVYDIYYIDYLRYRLAQRICSEYGITMQAMALQELKEFEETLTNVSPPDITIQKVGFFQSGSSWNWADVNTGHGWRPRMGG